MFIDGLSVTSGSHELADTDSSSFPPSSRTSRSMLGSDDGKTSAASCTASDESCTFEEGDLFGDGGVSPRVSPLHGGVSPAGGGFVPIGSTHWSEGQVVALNAAQRGTLMRNALLRVDGFLVGSDCSGSDAVWEALSELSVRWRLALECQYRFRQEFCSEHPGRQGDTPRNFLYLNPSPGSCLEICAVVRTRATAPITRGTLGVPMWMCIQPVGSVRMTAMQTLVAGSP